MRDGRNATAGGGRPLSCPRLTVIVCGVVMLLAIALTPNESAAQGQLRVTVQVVNHCTVKLAAKGKKPPGVGHWRRAVQHGCDFPVEPRLTLKRVMDQIKDARRGLKARDGYFVITVTY